MGNITIMFNKIFYRLKKYTCAPYEYLLMRDITGERLTMRLFWSIEDKRSKNFVPGGTTAQVKPHDSHAYVTNQITDINTYRDVIKTDY